MDGYIFIGWTQEYNNRRIVCPWKDIKTSTVLLAQACPTMMKHLPTIFHVKVLQASLHLHLHVACDCLQYAKTESDQNAGDKEGPEGKV